MDIGPGFGISKFHLNLNLSMISLVVPFLKCKLNGKYIKLGEQEIIETETSKQTCTCLEASRTSCMIEAKPLPKSAEEVSDPFSNHFLHS